MRITFPFGKFVIGVFGGMEVYARNLVAELYERDAENKYLLLCTRENEGAFPVTRKNFRKQFPLEGDGGAAACASSLPARVLAGMERHRYLKMLKQKVEPLLLKAMSRLSSAVPAGNGDGPGIVHHMFTVYPYWQKYNSAVVLTMHDIQQEYYPDLFTPDDLENRKKLWRPSAEKADRLIVISAFTKQTIVEKYAIPPEKIDVVHLGHNAKNFRMLAPEDVERFRQKAGLPQKFLLYPAATWAHKNHINLLRAFRILKDSHKFEGKLVLTGIKTAYYQEMETEMKRLGLGPDVLYLGYLPTEDIPALYNAATMMVFPSFFEGFGMPVVEAMAVGLPVVCSDATSLPEIAGDAALYFSPGSPEDMADRVWELWSDPALRQTLIAKGRKRADLFTWSRCAEETLKVYEKVYREKGWH